jgi:hypothetical protein
MAVLLTVSKTLSGAQVSDVLSGDPGNAGVDLGQVVNGQYTPITNQVANTGHQDVYIRHDATVDLITDVKTYVAQFSQVYGGADTAAADISTLIAKGQADNEATANNSDGFASGLRVEHNGFGIGGLGASAFLPSRAQVDIYGDAGTDGIDLDSAFVVHEDAMVWDNASTETDAGTPVAGQIGKSGDTTLGDHAHVGLRFFLEDAAADGGILQWDWVIAYTFTS